MILCIDSVSGSLDSLALALLWVLGSDFGHKAQKELHCKFGGSTDGLTSSILVPNPQPACLAETRTSNIACSDLWVDPNIKKGTSGIALRRGDPVCNQVDLPSRPGI